MYQIFYWIHIISYISWLIAFVASVFLAYKVGKKFETSAEKKFMQLERKATSIGAHIGAVGILISGPAMASLPGGPQWGWFPFHTYSWLATKQVIFIVILILVVFSIIKSVAFKKQLRRESGEKVSTQARQKWKSAYRVSLAVYMLVVVNTYLGLVKPF